MLDISGQGNDGISIYKQTIKFVTNDDTEIKETDIEELAEILIAALKNKMTKYCEDCCKKYVVERGDKPKKSVNCVRMAAYVLINNGLIFKSQSVNHRQEKCLMQISINYYFS